MHSCKSLFKTFCSKHVGNLYLVMEGGGRGGVNNFLQADWCLELVKCFKIFHFRWNFWKFNYFFSFWILPSIVLKCWIFPDNLDIKGKILAKFLLRKHFLSMYTNMTVKQNFNHRAIQKVRHLHNGIFHSINLCCTFSILLYHLLLLFNYGMRKKKIFCTYGCFSICYIKR